MSRRTMNVGRCASSMFHSTRSGDSRMSSRCTRQNVGDQAHDRPEGHRADEAGAHLAAWDVHRARLFGRCERRSGIAPFDRLVDDVMTQEPYRSARRVFWVMDNRSAHRGAKADARLKPDGRRFGLYTHQCMRAG